MVALVPPVFEHALCLHSNSQNEEHNYESKEFEYHNRRYKIINLVLREIVPIVKK